MAKSGLNPRGQVWKSWSAVKGKLVGKLVVSVNRFFQMDLSVLYYTITTDFLII